MAGARRLEGRPEGSLLVFVVVGDVQDAGDAVFAGFVAPGVRGGASSVARFVLV